jgi:hypothetical protein
MFYFATIFRFARYVPPCWLAQEYRLFSAALLDANVTFHTSYTYSYFKLLLDLHRFIRTI